MRNVPSLLIGLSLFVAAAGCHKPGEVAPRNWKPFSSGSGKFSVIFPGVPKEKVQPSAGGDVQMHNFVATVDLVTSYMVTYNDLPATGAAPDPALVFDNRLAGAMARGGTLKYQTDLKVGTYPAREYEHRHGDYTIRNRMVLAGRRLYQVVVVSSTAHRRPDDVAKFMESFSVTD